MKKKSYFSKEKIINLKQIIFKMKLRVKDVDIATGGIKICLLHESDASRLDLHPMDRVIITKGSKRTIAALDIAESAKAVAPGSIGLFEEVLDILKAKHNDTVDVELANKPASVTYIKKKLDGYELNKTEIHQIIKDIVCDELTDIELTSYITGNYVNGMTMKEIVDMTKAMMDTGTILKFGNQQVVDLHSIGGVPGNRTTIIVVPILAAAGLKIPKTSTRAITSPAGTADTMEVLTKVEHHPQHLIQMIKQVGAFIVWGGSVNLAPADDKIIKVESPLGIDAEGQMLASIMSKKASVGANYLLMEIPVGPDVKVKTRAQAQQLANNFKKLAERLKIKIKMMITDAKEPIGNGIGPALEAKDCLWVLQNDPKGPKDLREKSLVMAGEILEFVGKTTNGYAMAEKILTTGKAYDKMKEIIKAQGGRPRKPEDISIGKETYNVKAWKTGKITAINNIAIARTARIAGAPQNKGAGIYLHKHCGDHAYKDEILYTIYAPNATELKYAIEKAKEYNWGFEIN